MNRAELWKRHFELMDEVNGETDPAEYDRKRATLYGFRLALDALGIDYCVRCDMYYIGQGIDRPMTAGVWHQPEKLT